MPNAQPLLYPTPFALAELESQKPASDQSVANRLLSSLPDQRFIPKAACFWILVEGHSASRRAVGTACLRRSAPWFQMGVLRAGRPVSTRRGRPCPLLFRYKVQFQRDNAIRSTMWTLLGKRIIGIALPADEGANSTSLFDRRTFCKKDSPYLLSVKGDPCRP